MTESPLYYRLNEYPVESVPRLSLAIGIFDGVHVGHQALLREASALVLEPEADCKQVGALTFDPHPAVLFAPDKAPALLGTLSERATLLRQAGADVVIVVPFDRAFAALTPDEFVRNVLVDRLHVGGVAVGEDFRFGRAASGNTRDLRLMGSKSGFQTRTLAPVVVDGIPARSTAIRDRLGLGDASGAAKLLGRAYSLSGTVVHGRKLGRTIGFPTVNLESAPNLLVPASGVFAGRVRIDNEVHRAAISIGENPTVAAPGVVLPRTVEAFILDGFDRDVYGYRIAIDFVARLRPMARFDGLPALVEQMQLDVRETERLIARADFVR